jgi:hypothetical protein
MVSGHVFQISESFCAIVRGIEWIAVSSEGVRMR